MGVGMRVVNHGNKPISNFLVENSWNLPQNPRGQRSDCQLIGPNPGLPYRPGVFDNSLSSHPPTMTHRLLRPILGLCAAALSACAHRAPLPQPTGFEPARYLGKWHEVARLPAFYQADDTMATAEYGPTSTPGVISVFNQAYDRDGKPLNNIRGSAVMAKSPPPGRFSVSFDKVPKIFTSIGGPNYHVMHVDPDYRYAVVGIPSRKALWILAREVPIPPAKLAELTAIAKQAGFDTSKLIISPWR